VIPLQPRQLGGIRDALVRGYGSWQDWVELVAVALDMSLPQEVAPGPIKKVAWDVLELTEQQGTTEILLREAVSRRPRNPFLITMARGLGLAAAPFTNVVVAKPADASQPQGAGGHAATQLTPDQALEFEAIVRPDGFAKTGEWRRQMLAREHPVCQILYDNEPLATGFLIGPDRLMSNYHTFADPTHMKLRPLERFSARFDYRATDPNTVASIGTVVPIEAAAGYLDSSPPNELDYAIVKLAAARGEDPMPGGGKRGWLHPDAGSFGDRDSVFVLQHPAARTLELAVGPIVGWRKGHEQQVYEHLANTEKGSSGSPCFSWPWVLRALHHRGEAGKANYAISMAAILERMGTAGTLGLLDPRT
jgi:hypothetical protein